MDPSSRAWSGIAEGKRSKVNDHNQYKAYSNVLRDFSSYSELSFPVSEESQECQQFQKHSDAITTKLEESRTEWQSVDCVGRVYKDPSIIIRTTLVVTFAKLPGKELTEPLKLKLEEAIGEPTFPIEFAEGSVVKALRGFRRKNLKPLVCGASCGVGSDGSGTIGGFITIEGDPDAGAIYAVTNHHVVSESDQGIPWRSFKDPEASLGLSDSFSEDVEKLGRETVGRKGIADISDILDSLDPPSKRHYGEDRESYIKDFLKQFFQQRRREREVSDHIDEKGLCRSIIDRIQQCDDFGQDSFDRVLEKYDLRRYRHHLLNDMATSVCPHGFVLAESIEWIIETLGNNEQEKRILERLLYRRSVWRNSTMLPLVVEHPSQMDSTRLRERLDRDMESLEHCNQFVGSSGEREGQMRPQDDQQAFNYQRDLDRFANQRTKSETHSSSPDRLIGLVWASSGERSRPFPNPDSVERIREDWAIIKLFKKDGQTFSNSFSTNSLRPKKHGDHFRAVKPWLHSSRFEVCKRGRTTNYTISKSNGPASIVRWPTGNLTEHAVTATPYNGNFALRGDSGSWIMDRVGQLVGMVWGINETRKYTYFTPADYIFRWIQEKFVEAMNEEGLTLEGSFRPGGRIKLWSFLDPDPPPVIPPRDLPGPAVSRAVPVRPATPRDPRRAPSRTHLGRDPSQSPRR